MKNVRILLVKEFEGQEITCGRQAAQKMGFLPAPTILSGKSMSNLALPDKKVLPFLG